MSKRKKSLPILLNKKDSVGLFSGQFKSQVFKDKIGKILDKELKEGNHE